MEVEYGFPINAESLLLTYKRLRQAHDNLDPESTAEHRSEPSRQGPEQQAMKQLAKERTVSPVLEPGTVRANNIRSPIFSVPQTDITRRYSLS